MLQFGFRSLRLQNRIACNLLVSGKRSRRCLPPLIQDTARHFSSSEQQHLSKLPAETNVLIIGGGVIGTSV